jgi:hypothetical protein
MKTDIGEMKADIVEIKENTEITRYTVNTLGNWVDHVAQVVNVPYPYKEYILPDEMN